jgi:glucosamine-6-phosphate deaminase
VFVIFSGHGRSQCLQQALEGGVSHMCPVSAFQQHDGCTCIADENATADLKMKTVP